MEILMSFPAQGLAGTTKNSDLVFLERGDQTFAHQKRTPKNPRSTDQIAVRTYIVAASRAWSTALTEQQRTDWKAYAAADVGYSGSGADLFASCNFYRQLAGLAIVAPAPTNARPPVVTSAVCADAGAVTDLVFNCVHPVPTGDVGNYLLAVRYTPPTPSQQVWRPKHTSLRYCAHVDPDSIPSLVASGGEINVSGCQFTMGDGLKFGLSLRIIEESTGLAGPEYWNNQMSWSLG
jgi:hypothetical protein